jgi:hypothetical protein
VQGPIGAGERAILIGKAGTLPSTGTDIADVYMPVPYACTMKRMKVTAKGVTSALAVQLRTASAPGNEPVTWSDVSGFNVTFASTNAIKVVDPADVAAAEGDFLGFSITANGSGTDLVVEVVIA